MYQDSKKCIDLQPQINQITARPRCETMAASRKLEIEMSE